MRYFMFMFDGLMSMFMNMLPLLPGMGMVVVCIFSVGMAVRDLFMKMSVICLVTSH